MRFHSQNLNDLPGKRQGSMIRNGRCWLSFKSSGFRLEWVLFKRAHMNGFDVGLAERDEDAISINVGFMFFALYFSMNWRPLRRIMERITSREAQPHPLDQCEVCLLKQEGHGLGADHTSGHHFKARTYWSTNGRSMGIRWFEGLLWVDLWNDPMEHRSVDPWWWHISICPVDILLGRANYEERMISKGERVVVPMPEGGYAASVDIFESVWRRKRWPWAWRRMIRSTITPDVPIPFPGKGENAWDCGEDATHSQTGSCSTAFEAALALSKSVMRDRVRHGGWSYRPEAMAK